MLNYLAMNNSRNRIVLVTGATRGVGKGAATALAGTNTTVYFTGRSTSPNQHSVLPGTLQETEQAILQRGGNAIAIKCDHTDDAQVQALIARIIDEQGKLDILVNNVYQVPDDLLDWKPFWERPIDTHWNAMIKLGLRAHYVACHAVAPHMVAAGHGMIVNISSPAARAYIHSVIYGIGKAGKDKMMQDMAKELKEHNVAAFALWPGIVKTERLQPAIEADTLPPEYEALKPGMESPEFSGRIIDAIDAQGKAMELSGQSWWNSQLASDLQVQDIDGSQPEPYDSIFGNPVAPSDAMVQ